MKRLDGKVAIVTGAGKGIGKAIALRIAKEGAKCSVNDIDLRSARSVVEQILSGKGHATVLHGDATKAKEVERMVNETLKASGKIDILVNNVGLFSYVRSIVDMDEEEWDRGIEINLKSTFLWSKFVAKHMIQRKYGKIVNVSSVAGKIGAPKLGAYGAAKHGVLGLTKTLSLELAPHGINVNAVCPGYVETSMAENYLAERTSNERVSLKDALNRQLSDIPLGRKAKPDEIANVVAFLVSDEAAYLTGQAINVSGGQTMH